MDYKLEGWAEWQNLEGKDDSILWTKEGMSLFLEGLGIGDPMCLMGNV